MRLPDSLDPAHKPLPACSLTSSSGTASVCSCAAQPMTPSTDSCQCESSSYLLKLVGSYCCRTDRVRRSRGERRPNSSGLRSDQDGGEFEKRVLGRCHAPNRRREPRARGSEDYRLQHIPTLPVGPDDCRTSCRSRNGHLNIFNQKSSPDPELRLEN
ncbi:hypothetical protein C8R46DRAFT_127877 [Mycena filopes]|nr:hypothetical protein C8R46DRAFT_127877 [Mycena filopes]